MSKFNEQIFNGPLKQCSDLAELNLKDGYTLVPVVHSSWKTSKRRLLVIVESVDSIDIRNGKLLSGSSVDLGKSRLKAAPHEVHNPMISVLGNILQKTVNLLGPYQETYAETEDPIEWDDMAFGCVNFNAAKTRHLSPKEQGPFYSKFTTRVLNVIEALKPTHVLVCGDTVAKSLHRRLEHSGEHDAPNPTNSQYKRGWVFGCKYGKTKFLMTTTLDLEHLYRPRAADEDDEDDNSDKYGAADLLYFVARNILNLFAERRLHDISHIKPNAVYVDTIEKFDSLMEKLQAADVFGCDSETKNLSTYFNAIYFLQFAFSTKRGYVLPVEHPRSPFTKKEQKYIKGRLAAFFGDRNNRHQEMITLNGMFDLRILRSCLKVKFINQKVYEITAGEQGLDENLGLMTRGFKVNIDGDYQAASYGNLRNLCMYYGNDFYYCIAEDQVVVTDNGRKPIQEVSIGDRVLSYDNSKDAYEFKEVTMFKKQSDRAPLVKITHETGVLVVTPNHPVWSHDRETYVRADSILPGERLRVEQ